MRHVTFFSTTLLTALVSLQLSFAAVAAPTTADLSKLPLKTIERQAKAGDTPSQVELARRSGTGDGGAKMDLVKAANLLQAPVEKGDPTALYYLGVAYATGSGVPLDESKAVLLYD